MEEKLQFTRDGWRCPKCGRIFSPSVTECEYCNKVINTTSIITTTTGSEFIYENTSNTSTTDEDDFYETIPLYKIK